MEILARPLSIKFSTNEVLTPKGCRKSKIGNAEPVWREWPRTERYSKGETDLWNSSTPGLWK
jgi:hypothetical protein